MGSTFSSLLKPADSSFEDTKLEAMDGIVRSLSPWTSKIGVLLLGDANRVRGKLACHDEASGLI